jgi:hypothetical protein
MQTHPDIGILIPEILLPGADIDLTKWAVIACDQYTSQPEYWQQVQEVVGSSPSTLQLVLPEIYLEQPDVDHGIQLIQSNMRQYLASDFFVSRSHMVFVERSITGRTRQGIVLALDLEKYDYQKGARSLIRATEGTIVDRLPPRIKIREGARLELPHILVLIDDPEHLVIQPVARQKNNLTRLYDFELMLGSGHLQGYAIDRPELESQVIQALRNLADPGHFASKYGLAGDHPVLLYAMGDGNHSLATAKAYWEKIKPQAGLDHPARYALVEIENVHDDGLEFEPIHRVLFSLKSDLLNALQAFFPGRLQIHPVENFAQMTERVDHHAGSSQVIGFCSGEQRSILEITRPEANLPVGTLQPFLDQYIADAGAEKIDYVHGQEVLFELASQRLNAGFYLPAMSKDELFRTVILDGALPRKTFSMGEAHEKRFYMESRRIA